MHMLRVLGSNLDDDRQPRLATDDSRHAAGSGRTEHGVALEVAQPQSLFDHLRTVADAGGIPRSRRVFPAIRTFTPTPQHRFPVLALVVLLDPGVDRLRRNGAVAILLLHPARDLGWRPFLRQSATDGLVHLGIVHLPRERPLPAPSLGLTLRL